MIRQRKTAAHATEATHKSDLSRYARISAAINPAIEQITDDDEKNTAGIVIAVKTE